MYNVPIGWWNQMAKDSKLQTNWGKRYFHLEPKELDEAMEQEVARLEKMGIADTVINAFLLFAPTIAEPKAICSFARKIPMVRNALPEINDHGEAVAYAAREYRLDEAQQRELLQLLKTEECLMTPQRKEERRKDIKACAEAAKLIFNGKYKL